MRRRGTYVRERINLPSLPSCLLCDRSAAIGCAVREPPRSVINHAPSRLGREDRPASNSLGGLWLNERNIYRSSISFVLYIFFFVKENREEKGLKANRFYLYTKQQQQ